MAFVCTRMVLVLLVFDAQGACPAGMREGDQIVLPSSLQSQDEAISSSGFAADVYPASTSASTEVLEQKIHDPELLVHQKDKKIEELQAALDVAGLLEQSSMKKETTDDRTWQDSVLVDDMMRISNKKEQESLDRQEEAMQSNTTKHDLQHDPVYLVDIEDHIRTRSFAGGMAHIYATCTIDDKYHNGILLYRVDPGNRDTIFRNGINSVWMNNMPVGTCLLYTSPSPRD